MTMKTLKIGPAFYRGHGLGNDYLVFEKGGESVAPPPVGSPGESAGGPDEPVGGPHESPRRPGTPAGWPAVPSAIQAVCRRWTGEGADGIVVLVEPGAGEPFGLRMFNPDGSEFERSGNGLRILASYLHRTGRVGLDPFQVKSGGSLIGMQVHEVTDAGAYDVSVDMGRARIGAAAVALEGTGVESQEEGEEAVSLLHPQRGPVAFVPVSVGNPHAVVFTEDLSPGSLEALGPFLSTHPAFRQGTNVQLARVVGERGLEIAIWERGVGRTSASGTSSCAAAVAAVRTGRLSAGDIVVEMEGGTLFVGVTRELGVTLRGPVQEVSTGRLTDGFLRGLTG